MFQTSGAVRRGQRGMSELLKIVASPLALYKIVTGFVVS